MRGLIQSSALFPSTSSRGKGLLDSLWDIVPAVKPQAAYYEQYGWQGMRTLAETIAYAKSRGLFVIVDGKRNDIGATKEAFGADALTVNGYLGSDCIEPLLKVCTGRDKGIFVLAKTSNPSSGELQDQMLHAMYEPVYRAMGNMCQQWGLKLQGKYGYSGVGAVVGATYPKQLREMRKALPNTFFLVPGYGAQGGGCRRRGSRL